MHTDGKLGLASDNFETVMFIVAGTHEGVQKLVRQMRALKTAHFP